MSLYRKWQYYGNEISRLLEKVEAMDYDGATAREKEPNYWEYDTSDRYLLPQQSAWLTADELLSPLPVPEFPLIPQMPPGPNVTYEYILRNKDELIKNINSKRNAFQATFQTTACRLNDLRARYLSEEADAIASLVETAHKRHSIGSHFQNNFRAFAEQTSRILLIEIQFPDFAGHKFQIGETGSRRLSKPKYASETQKKKIVRQCLYSLVIRAGYLASIVLETTSYTTIAINVSQDWFDRATGAPRTGIICSLQGQVHEFRALHLDKIDPEVSFKHFKGIAVPSFDSISPIRPIFVLNKNDDRFIATKELDSLITPEANLAAMPWEDFEQLVAQLFEWEFAKEGVEVKVTRASRDRGVDAVLFDPDPLRGGKFVLQAKRYTNPVDVAAVRDLYGTLVNEGANRGILITTSSYGPDSYAFAKDKPISLVDGPNLLEILRRHGKKYRIDLEEARRLYQEG
ncbi:MAG: restriction endonuclease [Nitrososphaerales archaeon]|jgi:restriction system protein